MVKCFCDPATFQYSVVCPQSGKLFRQTYRSQHMLKSTHPSALAPSVAHHSFSGKFGTGLHTVQLKIVMCFEHRLKIKHVLTCSPYHKWSLTRPLVFCGIILY